jgi:hypothetical protein
MEIVERLARKTQVSVCGHRTQNGAPKTFYAANGSACGLEAASISVSLNREKCAILDSLATLKRLGANCNPADSPPLDARADIAPVLRLTHRANFGVSYRTTIAARVKIANKVGWLVLGLALN